MRHSVIFSLNGYVATNGANPNIFSRVSCKDVFDVVSDVVLIKLLLGRADFIGSEI